MYDEDDLTAWDEELLESLDKVVESFSSEDNLDSALDDGIFADATAASTSYDAADGV